MSTGSDGPGKEEKDDTIPASAFDLEADREKFKKGTLKREAYEMLEKHWPELKDTNELWEQGLKENRCLGKSKAVLASGLSHDAVFVRVPGGPNGSTAAGKWALRCFVGQLSKKDAGEGNQAVKKVEIQTKSSGMAGSKGPSSFELLSKVQVLVSKTPTNKDEEDENNVDNNDSRR